MFHNTQDFDPGPAVYTLSTNGGVYASDVFVCKLNTDGYFIWAASFGGTSEDYATGLAVDNSENIYTTGVFSGTADFDPGDGVYNLTSPSGGGVFIHKMSPCKNIPPVTLDVTRCKGFTLNNITYKSSGSYTQLLTSNSGCDSIINLHLKINTLDTNLRVMTCDRYSFHSKSLTVTGKYSDTIQTASGCDSIVHLDLTITKSATSINAAICSGEAYAGHTIAGTYTDTFHTANGCDSLVTVHLSVFSKPALTLGPDSELCAGDSIVLVPGSYRSYLWQDGATASAYTVKKAGLYTVTVSNICGVGHDEVRVTEGDCKIYFPTAFTPNNDGKNERFALLHARQLTDFHLWVYNRYGELVFQTKDYTAGWTGTFKSSLAPAGTYVWYCQFKEAGVVNNLKGTVLLVR